MSKVMAPRTLSALCRTVLIWLLSTATLFAAELTATVDRTRVALDETLRLTLTVDEKAASDNPDLSLLDPYFDILSTAKSTQLQIVNGRSHSQTRWTLTLAPKMVGHIVIPPFRYQDVRSNALEIEVVEPRVSAGNEDYFLELSLDKERAYVDAQILLTVRLHSAVPLSDLSMQPLEVDGAEVINLGNRHYERQGKGRRFAVLEQRYALFPRSAGTLSIPPVRLSALKNGPTSLFDRSRGERIRLTSQERKLSVMEPPADLSGGNWLPAVDLQLSQELDMPDKVYRVGQPFTRRLTLSALGVPAAQLPSLVAAAPDGFRQYPEPAQTEEGNGPAGIESQRQEILGLVPVKAGNLELPAVRVQWWDTTADRLRTAELPALRLQVLPAPSQPRQPSLPPPPQADPPGAGVEASLRTSNPTPSGSSWLLWTNLAWALLCLLFALLWWRARKQAREEPCVAATGPESSSAAQAWQGLQQACAGGDPRQVRAALIRWAHGRYAPGRETPVSLQTIIEQERQPELEAELAALDARLYGHGQGDFDARRLLKILQALPERRAGAGAGPSSLPALYPSHLAE